MALGEAAPDATRAFGRGLPPGGAGGTLAAPTGPLLPLQLASFREGVQPFNREEEK